jgi:kynurenine 3-monooxygenase
VDFSRSFIEHSYKEFHLSPAKDAAAAIAAGNDTGGYQLQMPHGLHIWPRHEFMLIALPNPDRTFTCTLFAPDETFAELDAAIAAGKSEQVHRFFAENFPDALELIGKDCVVSQYIENPKGSLVTVRVKPWRLGRLLLIGDAAHAVVPFFGQGMNAAFEDALEFNCSLDRCGGDLDAAAAEFALRRQPAGEGLADLSLENYAEMRSHTASPLWVLSKQIESVLHAVAPAWWVPRYTMVSFARVPYHEARDIAHRQEHALSVAGAVAMAGMVAAGVAGGVLLARDAAADFAGIKSAMRSAASAVGLPTE